MSRTPRERWTAHAVGAWCGLTCAWVAALAASADAQAAGAAPGGAGPEDSTIEYEAVRPLDAPPERDPGAGPATGPPVLFVDAPVEVLRPSSPDGAALLARAEEAARSGDDIGARAALRRVALVAPGSVEAAVAQVRLAEAALGRRDFAAAQALLGPETDGTGLPAALEVRAALARGVAAEGLDAFAEAEAAYRRALTRAPDPATQATAARGLARTRFLRGDVAGAEAAVAALPEAATPDAAALRQALAGLVGPAMTPSRAEALWLALPAASPWRPYAALQHARFECVGGRVERCMEAAAFAAALGPEPAWRAEAEQLATRGRAWWLVRPRTVGVLLPLTGKYAAIGQAAKEGIALALEGYAGVEVLWRDTTGDAEVAARLTEALILEDHVAALVGPVGQLEASAAVEVSARYRVPHAVLSSGERVGAGVPSVVRVRLSPEEQARAVARYAMTELSGRKVGVLYPQNESGQALAGAFWDEIERLGGEVWSIEGYPAGTTEFNPVLERFFGTKKAGKAQSELAALYLPDGALTVRRLLPFLKYWGVSVRTAPTQEPGGVQLLGAAGWNHPAVVDRGDYLSDNAVFVDAYFHDPDEPEVDRFAKRYYVRHQRRPQAFHAEAHDAAALVAAAVVAIDGADQRVREGTLARLMATRNHAGATGRTSVLPHGGVARAPWLLTLQSDEIRLRGSEEEERELRGLKRPGSEGKRR